LYDNLQYLKKIIKFGADEQINCFVSTCAVSV